MAMLGRNTILTFLCLPRQIKNLLFTGQSLNMHGIFRVNNRSIITLVPELLGKDIFTGKIYGSQ